MSYVRKETSDIKSSATRQSAVIPIFLDPKFKCDLSKRSTVCHWSWYLSNAKISPLDAFFFGGGRGGGGMASVCWSCRHFCGNVEYSSEEEGVALLIGVWVTFV